MEFPISSKSEFSLSEAPVFELEDPSLDLDSLDCGSLPEVHSENLHKPEDRPKLFYKAFVFSLLIHLLLFLGLTFAYFNPDKRPVKEVHTWVVNLVPLIKEQPKGLKEGPTQNILSKPKNAVSSPPPEKAALPVQKMDIADDSTAAHPKPISPLPNEDLVAGMQSSNPPLPLEAGDKEVPPKNAINESVSQQLQAGQYLFRMKMLDQMVVYKFRYFQKSTRAQLVAMIQASLSEEVLKSLPERTAVVAISYPENGDSPAVIVEPESDPELGEILKEKIRWDTVNSPKKLGLPNQTMKVYVAIDLQGKINLKLSLL